MAPKKQHSGGQAPASPWNPLNGRNFTPAQVLCNQTAPTGNTCPIQHILNPNEAEIPRPKDGWPDIRGLHVLQDHREKWANGSTIDACLNMLHDGLYGRLKNKIHIVAADIEDMFTEDRPQNFERALGWNRFKRLFTRTEFTLWPINYGGYHWELCVIRKSNPDRTNDGWKNITHFCLMDSWGHKRDAANQRRNDFLTGRLKRFFASVGFTVTENTLRDVQVPAQKDGWSCGLRTYWAARQMINRIQELDIGEYDNQEALWRPIRGYFNPDFVRFEMMGLNAFEAIKRMDYKARMAVELVATVKRRTEKGEILVDAGDAMRPSAEPEQDVEILEVGERQNWVLRRGRGRRPGRFGEDPTTVPQTPAAPLREPMVPGTVVSLGDTPGFDLGRTWPARPSPVRPSPSTPRVAQDWSADHALDPAAQEDDPEPLFRASPLHHRARKSKPQDNRKPALSDPFRDVPALPAPPQFTNAPPRFTNAPPTFPRSQPSRPPSSEPSVSPSPQIWHAPSQPTQRVPQPASQSPQVRQAPSQPVQRAPSQLRPPRGPASQPTQQPAPQPARQSTPRPPPPRPLKDVLKRHRKPVESPEGERPEKKRKTGNQEAGGSESGSVAGATSRTDNVLQFIVYPILGAYCDSSEGELEVTLHNSFEMRSIEVDVDVELRY
ncbi:hypothetical protein GGS26DRAFT_595249 [Hypomontagnella submonticulosa]|nr:hypothetical protein GGS26DRAFT_595249 [Hypomontagnella submonticulosa]